MRISVIAIVVFLLFASSFILRDLFSDEKSSRSEKAAEREEVIAYSQPLSAERVSDHDSSMRGKEQSHDDDSAGSGNAVIGESDGDGKLKERRAAMIAEKTSYAKARKEWRTALNEARQEAIKSGDYTKVEALKAQEPTKSK